MSTIVIDGEQIKFDTNIEMDDDAAHMDIVVYHRAGIDQYKFTFDTISANVDVEDIKIHGPNINYSFIPNVTITPGGDVIINLFVNICHDTHTEIKVFSYECVGGDTWMLRSINGDARAAEIDRNNGELISEY